jgi:hypothetical protein
MRMNTTLQVSRVQKWSAVFLLLLVSLVPILSDMPIWGKVLTLILIGFVVAYQRLLQKPAERLVQLIQFDKETWRWSVLEPRRINKNNIVEGRLISVQSWLFVMVLRFETQTKHKTVMKNWVIWQDQVDRDDWRRLRVLARFWKDDVQRIQD